MRYQKNRDIHFTVGEQDLPAPLFQRRDGGSRFTFFRNDSVNVAFKSMRHQGTARTPNEILDLLLFRIEVLKYSWRQDPKSTT
jgi:hypothetical protein